MTNRLCYPHNQQFSLLCSTVNSTLGYNCLANKFMPSKPYVLHCTQSLGLHGYNSLGSGLWWHAKGLTLPQMHWDTVWCGTTWTQRSVCSVGALATLFLLHWNAPLPNIFVKFLLCLSTSGTSTSSRSKLSKDLLVATTFRVPSRENMLAHIASSFAMNRVTLSERVTSFCQQPTSSWVRFFHLKLIKTLIQLS